jgi:PPOX class probable F420-dependent enzyme
VTLGPDGSPHITIVWVGLDGDYIVSGHMGVWQKLRNVRRDQRLALSMETGGVDERGLARYLVVHGTARVTEGGGPELLQRLAHVYLGPDVRFPPMDNPPPGYVMRITPTSVGGVGPWQGAGGS